MDGATLATRSAYPVLAGTGATACVEWTASKPPAWTAACG